MNNELKARLQHRFENLLLDHATVVENGEKGPFGVCITNKDPQNRHIFFKQKKINERVLMSAFFLEILALGAIATTKGVTNESLGVFAGIFDFNKTNDLLLDDLLEGSVKYASGKSGFYKFKGESRCLDRQLFESGIMAFFYEKEYEVKSDLAPVDNSFVLPEANCSRFPVKNGILKHPDLVCLDELTVSKEGLAWGVYQYPVHHFCNRGHFPGNPIMMGVLQLTCIEDLLLEWLLENEYKGEYILKGNATIFKKSGVVVAQIKQFEIKGWVFVEGFLNQCEYQSIKKAIFKSSVIPNETLYINASFSCYN